MVTPEDVEKLHCWRPSGRLNSVTHLPVPADRQGEGAQRSGQITGRVLGGRRSVERGMAFHSRADSGQSGASQCSSSDSLDFTGLCTFQVPFLAFIDFFPPLKAF